MHFLRWKLAIYNQVELQLAIVRHGLLPSIRDGSDKAAGWCLWLHRKVDYWKVVDWMVSYELDLGSMSQNTTNLNSLNTTNPKNIRIQGTLEPSNSTYFANLTDPS